MRQLLNKFMKKILILSFLIFSLWSCEKLDKYTQFTLDSHATLTVLRNTPTQTPVALATVDLPINSEIFDDYNTSTNLIEKASIKKIDLQLTNPSAANFNFLTDIELYIEAEGLPKLRMAWKNNLPNNDTQTIELNNLSDNLSEYLKNNHPKITAIIKTDEPLNESMQLDVHFSFYIDSQLIGI